ncbi:MAG TPA: type II toxin-antitoxin system prevent-host-death family antitoxin [Reyranella sp.]|jgi:prevent-host-death family protein
MDTVGAFDAKTNFSALLERVERGEQIVITRRGKPVARLMPIATARKVKVSDAMAKLRKLRKGATLGGLPWKELRDAGRKY